MYIDGLPLKNGDFPWSMLNNQGVYIIIYIYIISYSHSIPTKTVPPPRVGCRAAPRRRPFLRGSPGPATPATGPSPGLDAGENW